MRILITNDDGIHAPGLAACEMIARALSDEVWIVAPETDQSGVSHSLSLNDPLRLREVGDKLENFPTSNGFDEMRDMLPYYAGVYAYDDLALHPNFPKNDKTFMAVWNQVDLSQWDGKAGEAPTAVKKEFTYADLATGDVVGAEALARFAGEPYRPPDEWFAEADDIGRGAELELAAIAAALDQLHRLPPATFLAVNASPSTAITPELDALLARHPGDRVVLELTEHTPVDDYGMLLNGIDGFRRRGGRIATDDTGAGYASFLHLLRLRPDIIKLDITLTRGIDADPARRALATALVSFATEISATIIAEGIELPGELEALQRIDIPWGQGYYLDRPGGLPLPDRCSAALQQFRRWDPGPR